MDLNELYLKSAELSRLKAEKALRECKPGSAYKHLRAARQDERTAGLYEKGKVTDIRSGKSKKPKGK
jgi:hypothetical protein